jgi:hypothetical protein
MILKVEPSLWEANSRSAGAVGEAKLAKKRQKIVETEVYKISDNRSSPYRSRASRAAARAAKEGAGDCAAGSPAHAAVLSQYDSNTTIQVTRGPTMMASPTKQRTMTSSPMAFQTKSMATGALGPKLRVRHTLDPTSRPNPPSRVPRPTKPRTARMARTATLRRAGTDVDTDSATAWPGSKPP